MNITNKEKDVEFEYEDNVNLFYCERCHRFLITEFDDKEPRECFCSCEHGKGIMKPILACDDFELRRNLQDVMNQLNDLISFRIALSATACDECEEQNDDPGSAGYKN
ncbi:MAG: hypothetical protein WC444_04240 [Candidatus Paceibacterota bacterium]